ncbi:MAG TPA: endonuclease/exonuclease/phosphatase family protein [Ilumatobacteraceae bacterium]|nr:endonuclease/exonuclease/phosphatase family protein [Ilumatobacteraceae bacterium]
MRPRKLRIGTWNILGRRRHHDSRVADDGAVYETVAKAGTDILCLQEVHFYDGEVDKQLREELEDAGMNHFVGSPLSPSHLDEKAQLGVGIAARFPLLEFATRTLSNPGLRANVRGQVWELHDKGLIRARIQLTPNVAVNVYSLHLFPFFEFGVDDQTDYVDKMWRELWDVVDGADEPTILAGDYNQTGRADAAKEFSRGNWSFCTPDTSTTSTGLSLDDVALSWAPDTCEPRVIPTFSDHHLVLVEIDLSTPPRVRDRVMLSDIGGASHRP